jgi:hypothetical protein
MPLFQTECATSALVELPTIAAGAIGVWFDIDGVGRDFWHNRIMRRWPSRFQPEIERADRGSRPNRRARIFAEAALGLVDPDGASREFESEHFARSRFGPGGLW